MLDRNKRNKAKFPFPIKKEWGQNFLLDKNLLQKIVDNCPIDEKTIIIEVGSGYGHLTEVLAKTNFHQIISCEKDIRLFLWLQSKWKNKQNKILFLHQDVLEIDWKTFCKNYKADNLNFLVVGNLPYGIANSLLCRLLENFELFKNFVFLVQKEVAQRWTATPQRYKKEYSALSVYINLIAKPKIVFKVPKQCFFPAPLVDGSLVRLEMESPPSVEKKNLVSLLVFLKSCFRHRRKTLWNNLLIASFKELEIIKNFQQLGYTKQTRPQELTAQEYLNLYRSFKIHYYGN